MQLSRGPYPCLQSFDLFKFRLCCPCKCVTLRLLVKQSWRKHRFFMMKTFQFVMKYRKWRHKIYLSRFVLVALYLYCMKAMSIIFVQRQNSPSLLINAINNKLAPINFLMFCIQVSWFSMSFARLKRVEFMRTRIRNFNSTARFKTN